MEKISPDSILLPEAFSSYTYSRLVLLLSENESWRGVAQSFGIFSKNDIERFGRTKEPAETLILELGARLCPIEFFCEILKKCNLDNILVLFKAHDPVLVTQGTDRDAESKVVKKSDATQLRCRLKAKTAGPLSHQRCLNNKKPPCQVGSTLTIENIGAQLKIVKKTCPEFELDYFDVVNIEFTQITPLTKGQGWTFRIKDGGDCYCAVREEGNDKVRRTNLVPLAVPPDAPVLEVQPVVSSICKVGGTVVLSVRAKGENLTYRWFRDSTEVEGSNAPSLYLKVKDESYEGIYRCYVWNEGGGVWSDESVLTVSPACTPEPSAKVALLIANQLYENLHCLETPENDVRTLARLLRGLGFYVIALQNLTLIEMKSIINYISGILPRDAYVVFYFSGHGFEICDKFMLPIDVPGPDDFLQIHALSERELLRDILKSEPMLFLEMLDMCLKAPSPSNRNIFNEKVSVCEYSARNNLILAYSTTSNSSAYEKRADENGLYVKHLKEYFLQKNEMPIVEILRNVAKDIAKVYPFQIPFFGTNVTMDYRLTDQGPVNLEIHEKIKALISGISLDFMIKFEKVDVESRVRITPYEGVFFNTLEVGFSDLEDFRVRCQVPGDELSLEFYRMSGDPYLKIMNIQRVTSDKILTLRLLESFGKCADEAKWVIKKPLIAAINLREEKPSSPEEERKSSE